MALAIQNLFWGIAAIFAGGLADRFGNVKVVTAGTLFYVLGMVMMAGVDIQWMVHISAGILVGAGIAGTSFGIVLPAMARAVGESRRQMALGLGTAAGSLGQFAGVPLAQQMITGLVAVMFGTRYMALLYGIVFLGRQLCSFSGVWLGGWLYDRSGSYDMVWWPGVAFSVMAAIVHWPIEEQPVLRLAAQNAQL